MSFLHLLWLIINLLLILLILIRNPNEQSLQETIGPFKLFDSSKSAEKKIDSIIQGLIIAYFIIGFISTSKAF